MRHLQIFRLALNLLICGPDADAIITTYLHLLKYTHQPSNLRRSKLEGGSREHLLLGELRICTVAIYREIG
jgi:hypothetical protein